MPTECSAEQLDFGPVEGRAAVAVLTGKLEAKRENCAPVAGKSTLNRLELSRPLPTRYHKISHQQSELERLFVDVFIEAQEQAPR